MASDRNTEGKYKRLNVMSKVQYLNKVNRIVIDSFPLLCTQTVTLSRDTAPGSHAIKIRRVTSKSDSLFPIILWGFRLPLRYQCGKEHGGCGARTHQRQRALFSATFTRNLIHDGPLHERMLHFCHDDASQLRGN